MRHIDSALLMKVVAGQLPPRTLLRVLAEHLGDLCPECGAALQLLVDADPALLRQVSANLPPAGLPTAGAQAADETDESPYAAAFHQAGQRALAYAAGLEGDQRLARRDLAELLALPADQRRQKVTDSSRSGLRARILAGMLIEESRSVVRRDPRQARELAELVAPVLSEAPDGEGWSEEVYALSLGHRANALRVGGDLRAADEAFRQLGAYVAEHALDDEEVGAEVASLEASLRLDQRRLVDAEHLLDRAIRLSRSVADQNNTAKNLIKLGEVQRLHDRLDDCAESVRRAIELLDPVTDLHLYLCAIGTLGHYLCDADRYAEAHDLLVRNRESFARHPERWMELRVTGLRGRVALGLGDYETAERHYLAARQGYVDLGRPYDAAAISLDLIDLYLDQGRTAELKELATLMVQIWESSDVQREAFAALLLFQNAATAERVNSQTIHGLRLYLERTRVDPRLRSLEPF